MKKNKILVLGDSFTYGHGCSDRIYYYDEDLKRYVGNFFEYPNHPPSKYCWASLLQENNPEYVVENISRPGNSNISMFGNLLQYAYSGRCADVCAIIFSATFVDRIEIASLQNSENTAPWIVNWYPKEVKEPDDYYKAKELYSKHLYNGQVGLHMTLASLMAAHQYAITRDIDFYWTIPKNGIPRGIDRTLGIMDALKFPHIHSYDFLHNAEQNLKCLAKDTHTNELGHKIYYYREIIPVMKKIKEKCDAKLV